MELRRPHREVALPAIMLTRLRQALKQEAGVLGATHALHHAGFASGEVLLELLQRSLETERAAEVPRDRFWAGFNRFFEEHRWGRMEHRRVHPALGMLIAHEWMEADPAGTESQAGCAFTSGVLAQLFGSIAAAPIGVLEVTCASRGDDACRFLFGSEAAVHEVYGRLLDGSSLEEALATV